MIISLSHLCPEETPAALDMIDRCKVRKVTAEQSGRVLFQFFSRSIIRESIVSKSKTGPGLSGIGDRMEVSNNEGNEMSKMEDDDETLTQIVARVEEKSVVPLEEYELPNVDALCFGYECCTCSSSKNPAIPCVCSILA